MVAGSKGRPHPGQVKACSFQIGTLRADRGLWPLLRVMSVLVALDLIEFELELDGVAKHPD